MLTASADTTARIWNAGTGKEMKAITGYSPMTSAVFDRYGERVLTLSGKKAQIWSGTTGKQVRILEAPGILTSAVFSPDNKSVLTSSADRIARIWY